MQHNNNISNIKSFYWHMHDSSLHHFSSLDSHAHWRNNFNTNYFSSSFVDSYSTPGLKLSLISNIIQCPSWLMGTYYHVSNVINFIWWFTAGYSLLHLRRNTCCFSIARHLLLSSFILPPYNILPSMKCSLLHVNV